MSCCCGAFLVGTFANTTTGISAEIEELVRKYGGNANAELRFTMTWNSWSDVDFHLMTPMSEISYSKKSDGFGALDVDMNIGSLDKDMNTSSHAVPAIENISYAIYDNSPDGEYRMGFNQYGVWDGRGQKSDVPLFVITRKYKISDSQRVGTDVLVLELDWDNLHKNEKANVALFKKEGPKFTLLKLAPGVTIKHITGTKITIPEQVEEIQKWW